MEPKTYTPKRHIVRAIQLLNEDDAEAIIKWVEKGSRMGGRVSRFAVARVSPTSVRIPTPLGRTLVREGNYVVETDTKVFFVYSTEEFEEEFTRIS